MVRCLTPFGMTLLRWGKRKEREKLRSNFSLSFSPSCPNVRHFVAEHSEARNLCLQTLFIFRDLFPEFLEQNLIALYNNFV